MIPTLTIAVTLTLWLTGQSGVLAFALVCTAVLGVMNYGRRTT